MRKSNSLPVLIFFVVLGIGLAVSYSRFSPLDYRDSLLVAVGTAILAFIVAYSIKGR